MSYDTERELFTSQHIGNSLLRRTLYLVMDDLDLYRRIEYPNETRQSWAVEGERDGLIPIVGSLLRRVLAGNPERSADS